ncbi:methyl-accepting chemotaxis protein [Maritalea mediterranea]|uniref:Methyl-accepting chemotaxis protein n=1 Tax=Maritalea mediterranea TaxID=2909667 RepID=A0ABS9E731_9HYPH|nr:methyl-accepting chemotaxis protein [Maritalea mediterranea]MCF4097261.1 methyl-accepting chemotaxis protein [Maritalea mediterranea]
MNKLKISARIYVLVALSLLTAGVLAFVGISSIIETRTTLRSQELKSITASAVGILQGAYDRVQAGEISQQDAQAQALRAIEDIRYRGNEYMFVIDNQGVMVMHPFAKALVGNNQLQMADANGKLIFKEIVQIATQQGEGYLRYVWPRGEDKVPVDKNSFVSYFEPWGLIVGTGVYIDDLRAANQQTMFTQLGITALIAGILFLVAFFIARSITKPLSRLTGIMGTIASGQHDVDVDGTERGDEIGEMARAVEVFRENGARVANLSHEELERQERAQQERARMMQELQLAFGEVVDAASKGDFSNRVDLQFPDKELNMLGESVNGLVETVERGLEETGSVLASLARTDLTHRVTGHYEGAFEKLKNDTNQVADRLTDIVSQLRKTSGGLKSATGEILEGANDLSERTTRQAATIEETSAAMEQLSGTVSDNAKKAQSATERTNHASKLATEGGAAMTQANEAMERITSSSAKISNIIGMIDDIAFQTNLLALNASVEAARAGEAGKGFAVVAVEVRRLAQNAADASGEVKQLIDQSAHEVSDGSKLVSDASAKLEEMLVAVRDNATLMAEIAEASNEQAAAIVEVSTAVHQMDEMTQHNAALVEETNAAIEQTETQASELDRIVEVFKLDGQPGVGQSRPAPRAVPKRAVQGNAAIQEEWAEF